MRYTLAVLCVAAVVGDVFSQVILTNNLFIVVHLLRFFLYSTSTKSTKKPHQFVLLLQSPVQVECEEPSCLPSRAAAHRHWSRCPSMDLDLANSTASTFTKLVTYQTVAHHSVAITTRTWFVLFK